MPNRKRNDAPFSLNKISLILHSGWFPYVCPFVTFILMTALAKPFPDAGHIIYTAKTFIVGFMLWYWRREYAPDISLKMTSSGYLISAVAGLLVLVIWVAPEEFLPKLGTPTGFDPRAFGLPPAAAVGLVAIRLAGAVLVVPVMEELFWRSFILRYAINPEFKKVALGSFTWFSFAAVVLLFGLEHFRVVQGIIAGVIYTLLVIRQKNLTGCIIAHGVTNLGLGIYVIVTESWVFW